MISGNLWIIVLILIVVSRVIAAMAEKAQQAKEKEQRRAGGRQEQPLQVKTRPTQTPPTRPGRSSPSRPATTLGRSSAAAGGDLAARRKAQLEELRKRRLTLGPGGTRPATPSRSQPVVTLKPSRAPQRSQPPRRPQPAPQQTISPTRRPQPTAQSELRKLTKLAEQRQERPARARISVSSKQASRPTVDAFAIRRKERHPIFGGEQPRDVMRRLIALREVLDAPVALRQGTSSDRIAG